MTLNSRLLWRKNRRVGPLKRPVPVGWKRSGKQTNEIHTKIKTRGVSNCGLAIYILKYLNATMETQIFHHAKI
jgi:hypothetical protein